MDLRERPDFIRTQVRATLTDPAHLADEPMTYWTTTGCLRVHVADADVATFERQADDMYVARMVARVAAADLLVAASEDADALREYRAIDAAQSDTTTRKCPRRGCTGTMRMIAEKQERAADEATTKRFKCRKCGRVVKTE